MSPKPGQPVVVGNRPGAATNIGAEAMAKSAPNGCAVFSAGNGILASNPALFRKLPYNPDRDFHPVGLMARFPLVLTVKQDSAIRSAGLGRGPPRPSPAGSIAARPASVRPAT